MLSVLFSKQRRSTQVIAESSSTSKQFPHLMKGNQVDVKIKCSFSFRLLTSLRRALQNPVRYSSS